MSAEQVDLSPTCENCWSNRGELVLFRGQVETACSWCGALQGVVAGDSRDIAQLLLALPLSAGQIA